MEGEGFQQVLPDLAVRLEPVRQGGGLGGHLGRGVLQQGGVRRHELEIDVHHSPRSGTSRKPIPARPLFSRGLRSASMAISRWEGGMTKRWSKVGRLVSL